MRLTVIVLLAVNLSLFAYLSWQSTDSEGVDQAVLPTNTPSVNVPSLVLASELLPDFAKTTVAKLKDISNTPASETEPCSVAGPIDSHSRAASIVAYVNSRGGSAEVAAFAVRSRNGFQFF